MVHKMPLRWVVTAPPRSGTTWISKWLTQHGYPTSHERVFLSLDPANPTRLRFQRCIYPGESSYLAAPFTSELREMGIKVIHLRRPLEDVAKSMHRLNWDLGQDTHFGLGARTFTPDVFDEEPFSMAQYLRFAEEWTELIQADTVWDLYDISEDNLTDLEGLT